MTLRMAMAVAGGAITATGVALFAYAALWTRRGVPLSTLAATASIIGVILISGVVFAKIRTQSEDEAFRLGVDIGYEKGYADGRNTGKPVVVEMQRPTPDEPPWNPARPPQGKHAFGGRATDAPSLADSRPDDPKAQRQKKNRNGGAG